MVDFMTTGQRNLRAPAMLEERRFSDFFWSGEFPLDLLASGNLLHHLWKAHHFEWIFPWNMVIFHSYVKDYQRVYPKIYEVQSSELSPWPEWAVSEVDWPYWNQWILRLGYPETFQDAFCLIDVFFFVKKTSGLNSNLLGFSCEPDGPSSIKHMGNVIQLMNDGWLMIISVVYGDRFRGYNGDRRRYINMILFCRSEVIPFYDCGDRMGILYGDRMGYTSTYYLRDCPVGFMAFETDYCINFCTWAKTHIRGGTCQSPCQSVSYPLVNIQKNMENHHF